MTREERLKNIIDSVAYGQEQEPFFSAVDLTNYIMTIYDDIEGCNGCSHEPDKSDMFPMICGECSRFYADNFEEDK